MPLIGLGAAGRLAGAAGLVGFAATTIARDRARPGGDGLAGRLEARRAAHAAEAELGDGKALEPKELALAGPVAGAVGRQLADRREGGRIGELAANDDRVGRVGGETTEAKGRAPGGVGLVLAGALDVVDDAAPGAVRRGRA